MLCILAWRIRPLSTVLCTINKKTSHRTRISRIRRGIFSQTVDLKYVHYSVSKTDLLTSRQRGRSRCVEGRWPLYSGHVAILRRKLSLVYTGLGRKMFIQSNPTYSVSQKNPPYGFLQIFPKRLGIFNQFLHTYYVMISTLDIRKKTSVYHTVNGNLHCFFHTSKTAKMIKVILLSSTLTFW